MSLDFFQGIREPAECEILVDQAPIDDLYGFLTELTVETSRAEATTASLVFESRRDEKGRWQVQDAGVFRPWAQVRIDAHFGSRSEEVMRGYVRDVSCGYPDDAGSATVRVECQDESLKMDRLHVRKVWGQKQPTTDRAILEEIARHHALKVHARSGKGLSGLVIPQDCTDVRLLRARADANGYELIFSRGEIYFGPPRLDYPEAQPTILVYAGADTSCKSLNITSDGHQPDQIGFHVAPTTGKEIRARTMKPNLKALGPRRADTGAGLDDFLWRLSREGSWPEDELAAFAQRRVNELSLRVRAEGEVDGSIYGHVLQVGLPVAVDGAGDWLGGTYYVDRVEHRFSADGYFQSVRLLRNAYGDDLAGGVPGPLAGVM